MSALVLELVETLGITPAEARRRLVRAVLACGGRTGHLAQAAGVGKSCALAWIRRNGEQLRGRVSE